MQNKIKKEKKTISNYVGEMILRPFTISNVKVIEMSLMIYFAPIFTHDRSIFDSIAKSFVHQLQNSIENQQIVCFV